MCPRRGRIRIASWPAWYTPNRYLPLFYQALESYGIEHVPHLPLTCNVLAGDSAQISVSHIHWPEPFWHKQGGGTLRQLWRVARFRRFLVAARHCGLRVIWTVHNLEPHDGAQLSDRLGYRFLYRAADLLIFHSESARRAAMGRYGPVGGDTLVMSHGNYDGAFPAPGPKADTLRREGIPPRRKVLLCFGQVRRYKGFDIAIEALYHLPNDEFHLVVAGRPLYPFAQHIETAAQRRTNVSLVLQDVGDQRLADLIAAADCVLLPYRSVTGSGALLAALTLSKGVVASDLPYFHEVLESDPDAGVFTARDPRALAGKILEFFAMPEARRGTAARAIASRFAWPRVVRPVAEWITTNAE